MSQLVKILRANPSSKPDDCDGDRDKCDGIYARPRGSADPQWPLELHSPISVLGFKG